MNEEWKNDFEPHILERGRQYWADGNVCSLSRDGDTVTAVVLGSEEYDVEIEFDDGAVDWMDCSCPYAEDGSACKHMAAVLFALEEDRADGKYTDDGFPKLPWQEAISALSPEELRALLTELAASDTGLQERLVLKKPQLNSSMLADAWKMQLRKNVSRYADRHGFIDYRNANDFYDDLDMFMEERLPELMQCGKNSEAFQLVCLIYETSMEQDADDSDGGCSMLACTCVDAWRELLCAADARLEAQMHQWFVSHLDMPNWSFGTEDVECFLFGQTWSQPLLRKNLELLDHRLTRQDLSKYALGELLKWREHTMLELGAAEEEVEAFWGRYFHLPFVRKRKVNRLLETGHQEEALSLLLKCKEMDAENSMLLNGYSEQLLTLYQAMGRQADYEKELRFQVFSCYQRDLEHIKALRAVTPPEQWPDLLEELLALPTTQSLRLQLMAYGEQYERLLQTILKTGQLHNLNEYKDCLCQWAPERFLEGYRELLKKAMKCASTRQMYKDVIRNLKTLPDIPGGQAVAQEVALFWRELYPRRRAMLEELAKVGF